MFALLLAMALLFPTACYAAGYDWPQFHNTVDGAGYSASSSPGAGNILWASDNVGANPSSSPVIAGGRVYVYSSPSGDGFSANSSAIACLDEASGATIWQKVIDTASSGSWSSPAYDSGKVFIGSAKKAYCLDAADGNILWSYALHYNVVNGSPRVADGKAFFTDWGGSVSYCYALDENSGDKIWEHQLVGYSQSTPAYDSGKVYVCSWKDANGPGSGANNVYCLNAMTGTEIWHQNGLKHDTCGSPSVADGKVFVGTYNFYGDGEVAALDAGDGHIIWVAVGPKDAGTHPGLNEVVGTVDIQRTDNTPAYADGKLFLSGGCDGFSDFDTYCFNAETGALIWDEPASLGLTVGNWTCSVAVAGGKVFVGKAKTGGYFDYGGLYALDAGDGHLVWSSGQGGSTPAVADGTVFSYSGGRVYAFGSTTVPVTGVTLEPDSLTLIPGASGTLTATVTPDNATDQGLTWTSSDEAVASMVYSGATCTVTGHVYGSATITVTTKDGDKQDFCLVTVQPGGSGSYDLNSDGRVNVQDLVLVGQHVAETGADGWIPEDVNQDGRVNVQDLVLIGQNLTS